MCGLVLIVRTLHHRRLLEGMCFHLGSSSPLRCHQALSSLTPLGFEYSKTACPYISNTTTALLSMTRATLAGNISSQHTSQLVWKATHGSLIHTGRMSLQLTNAGWSRSHMTRWFGTVAVPKNRVNTVLGCRFDATEHQVLCTMYSN